MNKFWKINISLVIFIVFLFAVNRLFFFPAELKLKWLSLRISDQIDELALELEKTDLTKNFQISDREPMGEYRPPNQENLITLSQKISGMPLINDEKGTRIYLFPVESEGYEFGSWLFYGDSNIKPRCERKMLEQPYGSCSIDIEGPWFVTLNWYNLD